MEDRPEEIRIDRSRTAKGGGFREGEQAYLRFTLDHRGIPFLDDLGGGWVSGEGPGWVLYHRKDPESDQFEETFFPGIALTDEKAALEAALAYLEEAEG